MPAGWRRAAAAILASALLAVGSAWAGGEAPPFWVKVDGRQLSVRAQGVALVRVMEEIRRQGRIRLHLDPRIAHETVAESFEALPLQEGLRRLLWKENFAILHSPAGVAEVWVFPQGGQAAALPRAGGATAVPETRETLPGDQESSDDEADDPAFLSKLRAEALGNPDPAQRTAALETIAASGDEDLARATTLEVLAHERNPAVLEEALGLLQGQAAVPLEPVLALASKGAVPSLRLRALELLGEHGTGDPRVSQLLKTLAEKDSSSEVRESARSRLVDLEELEIESVREMEGE